MWFLPLIVGVGLLLALGKSAGAGVAPKPAPTPSFAPGVEFWRPYLVAEGMDRIAPIPFLLAWLRVESGGNVGAVGKPTAEGGPLDRDGFPWEVGIWQLDPGNREVAGNFTAAELRPGCPTQKGTRAEVEHCTRPPTRAEISTQVRSGIGYLKFCRGWVDRGLAATGTRWSYPDVNYLRAVKSVHGSPWLMAEGIRAYTAANGPPATFNDLANWLLTSPPPGTPASIRAVIDNARKTWS